MKRQNFQRRPCCRFAMEEDFVIASALPVGKLIAIMRAAWMARLALSIDGE